jgi:hypothetical protein
VNLKLIRPIIGGLPDERLATELTQANEMLRPAAIETIRESKSSLAAFEEKLEGQQHSPVVAFRGLREVANLISQLKGTEEAVASLSVSECDTLARPIGLQFEGQRGERGFSTSPSAAISA